MCTLFFVVPLSLGEICGEDCSTVVYCRRRRVACRLRADADRSAGSTTAAGANGAAACGSARSGARGAVRRPGAADALCPPASPCRSARPASSPAS